MSWIFEKGIDTNGVEIKDGIEENIVIKVIGV